MLCVNTKVDNLEGLKTIIEGIKKQSKIAEKKDDFHKFIQDKCLKATKRIARQRLYASGTTNVDYYEDYIDNIRIINADEKGFTIISDLVIHKPDTHHSKGYDFSISLAFEYGTGITGMGSTDAPAEYRYNVNNNYVIIDDWPELGWWIPIDKKGNSQIFGTSKGGKAVLTRGYEAVEVFRFSAYEINTHLNEWVKSYYKKQGGIS